MTLKSNITKFHQQYEDKHCLLPDFHIAPSPQHSRPRLNESFEAIRQEFDVLASDLGLIHNQRNDFESKGEFFHFPPHTTF